MKNLTNAPDTSGLRGAARDMTRVRESYKRFAERSGMPLSSPWNRRKRR